MGAVGVHSAYVEWIDTDAAGIYHNSTVIRWVESAEAALMRTRGLADYFRRAPRVRYEVAFSAPLLFGQQVTTRVEVAEIGRSSMTFTFEVLALSENPEGVEASIGANGSQVAARGSYTTVHLDPDASDHGAGAVAVPWPSDWIAALGSVAS